MNLLENKNLEKLKVQKALLNFENLGIQKFRKLSSFDEDFELSTIFKISSFKI